MKSLLDKGFIQIDKQFYTKLIIVLLPLLNFLVGINIDLYAPSLPAISKYFAISSIVAKNTITITLVGFAMGCIVFGVWLDVYGRRRVILLGLAIYAIASFLALFSKSIEQLMIIRFFQGFSAAVVSIGPRTMLVDVFSGHELIIGLMYTSLAYALGPIVGPFFGGLIQYYLGWKANFIVYTFFAICLFVIFFLYVNESIVERRLFSWRTMLTTYKKIAYHKLFLAATFIVGGVQLEQMLYPTLGPFLIEGELKYSPIEFGNTALLVGAFYLFGTLCNRFMVRKVSILSLINVGFVMMLLGLSMQLFFAFYWELNLFTLVFPFILTTFSTGFLFANILALCLQIFPENAGQATALISCLLVMIASAGLLIISYLPVTNLLDLSIILSIIIFFQLAIYVFIFVPETKVR